MPTPGHLIGFVISPVQAFIREARKAQDVWAGSLLLSHAAKAALTTLDHAKCERVSPALVPGDDDHPERPSVTNEGVVFAPIEDETAASELAKRAARASSDWWIGVAKATRERIEGPDRLFRDGDLELWNEQIEAQFTVSWAVEPLADRDVKREAAAALRRLRKSLASAKRARCLTSYLGDSRPKCTLCGAWEQMGPEGGSIGEDNDFWRKTLPAQLRGMPRRDPVRWVVTARLEGGARERLCAVCLTKRLAPALVLVDRCGFRDHNRKDSQVRFPSTTALAWVEAKANLIDVARQRPETFAAALRRFNKAVDAYCRHADLPHGHHALPWHEASLADLPAPLHDAARELVQLDGGWLGEAERERDETGFAEEAPAVHRQIEEARAELRRARQALADLTKDATPRIGIGRTPPVAILRADADRMGKLSASVTKDGGLAAAHALSVALGERALPAAVDAIELECRGKVVFAGGDELIAFVPAARALKAASLVSQAYEKAGADNGFPQLTCSVAAVVVHPRSPLRVAINKLTELLDAAKEHRRDEPWPGGERQRSRRSFGLAIIPGSGNVKEGVVGLEVPRFAVEGVNPRHALDDVLIPLAEALTWEFDDGVSVSPKLYREWVDDFERFFERAEGDQDDGQGLEHLLTGTGTEGMPLAEFRRLANRHLSFRIERGRVVLSSNRETDLRKRLGADPSREPDELRKALIDYLSDRFDSLLRSGSYKDSHSRTSPRWDDLRGLLLGITTLGTREIG
jgi:CRISPR-associated protein Cmr2